MSALCRAAEHPAPCRTSPHRLSRPLPPADRAQSAPRPGHGCPGRTSGPGRSPRRAPPLRRFGPRPPPWGRAHPPGACSAAPRFSGIRPSVRRTGRARLRDRLSFPARSPAEGRPPPRPGVPDQVRPPPGPCSGPWARSAWTRGLPPPPGSLSRGADLSRRFGGVPGGGGPPPRPVPSNRSAPPRVPADRFPPRLPCGPACCPGANSAPPPVRGRPPAGPAPWWRWAPSRRRCSPGTAPPLPSRLSGAGPPERRSLLRTRQLPPEGGSART